MHHKFASSVERLSFQRHGASQAARQFPRFLPVLLLCFLLAFPALACNIGEAEALWTPEAPQQYTAVTEPAEVYVLLDQAGNVVDFEGAYAYGANARMHYELRFWDVGGRGAEGYEKATIFKIYQPLSVTAINAEVEKGLSDEQKTEVYARTSFPATEVQWTDLTFSGGPQGNFGGPNPDTGGDIFGYMNWREKEWEMHACFYYDVDNTGCLQDYLVLGEEPFYNWP